MIVAIAMFGEEVSPRFDCCGALAFADSECDFEAAEVIAFTCLDGERRLRMLLERKAQVLLCGGIRRCDGFRLEAEGVRVMSGLQGQARDCFAAFRAGNLHTEMPTGQSGCGCRRRQRKHGNGG